MEYALAISKAPASILLLNSTVTRAGRIPRSIALRIAWKFDPRPEAKTPMFIKRE
jgi:hypothetical protein